MDAHNIWTVGFGHLYAPGIWPYIWLAHHLIPLQSFANFQSSYTSFARLPSPVYIYIASVFTPGLCRLGIGSYPALGHVNAFRGLYLHAALVSEQLDHDALHLEASLSATVEAIVNHHAQKAEDFGQAWNLSKFDGSKKLFLELKEISVEERYFGPLRTACWSPFLTNILKVSPSNLKVFSHIQPPAHAHQQPIVSNPLIH